MKKRYPMTAIASRLLTASLLALLLFSTSGCTNSAASRNTRTNDEVYNDGSDTTYDEEGNVVAGNDEDQSEETSVDRRKNRPVTQRQRDHRRSMQNMGSWFLTALIGIGFNILLALLLWG
jgi:hypothetical protein